MKQNETMGGRALSILLVEDNLDHAELVRRNLEKLPVANTLHHVENGEAAVDYIFGRGDYADRGHFPAPDVVLLDLRLPRLDGLEVLRQVKSDPILHKIPVVVLTTSDAERDVAMAYEYHANSFLTKPVAFHRLSQLIADLGFCRLTWNKNPQLPAQAKP
jgi:CheY-like chemotaxis protein